MDAGNRFWYGVFHLTEPNPGSIPDFALNGSVRLYTILINSVIHHSYLKTGIVTAYILGLISICTITLAQDIEKIGKEKIIVVKGGIQASASYMDAGTGMASDPLMYNMSGNLDINILGVIDAPFSMYLGSKNKSFGQPSFRQFGISPRYKSLTAHIGYRNLTFTPYTLSGMTFLGGGLEYSPREGKIKVALMTGRLRKEISSSDGAYYNPPGYERWGWGLHVTAGSRDHQYGLTVFRAWDKVKQLIAQDSGFINPQENLVLGLSTSQNIIGKITLSADYTLSMITGNIYSEGGNEQPFHLQDILILTNASTHKAGALNLKMGTNFNRTSLAIVYRRIDPGFESFGCTYMSNDLQEWLANASTGFFGNKISITSELGVEKNNLSHLQSSTTSRVIGSANINYLLGKHISGGINYSNFNATRNPGYIVIADSFRYIQTTRNIAGSLIYTLPGNIWKSDAGLNFSFQDANTLNYYGTQKETDNNQFYSAVLFIRLIFTNIKLNFTGNLNWSSFIMKEGQTLTSGPSFTCGKAFLKDKMSVSASFGYNLSKEIGRTLIIHTFRSTLSYKAGKSGTFNLYGLITHRKSRNDGLANVNGLENRTNLSYVYSF